MTKGVKHSAPGPYLGFALQPVRLCYHLLSCPESAAVSLEHLDDVAIHYEDGTVLVEQAKSALSHNALSDWSEDLWKTVANWLTAVDDGSLDANGTKFFLYVTPVKSGTIAKRFHDAKNSADVEALTTEVEKKLAAKKSPPGCLTHVQGFLNASEKVRVAVVTKMQIFSVDKDPVDALRTLLKPAIAADALDLICASAIGMAQARADSLLRQGHSAIINASEFLKQFHAFVQKNNLPGLLTSFANAPELTEIEQVLNSKPCFVKQLELVRVTPEQQLRAVSDYLRTCATKSEWAARGLVYARSFEEWDDALVRHHVAISSEVEDVHAEKTEAVRGRITYSRCSQVQQSLEGREVPGHFSHGSFNALAEERVLGWHPRFQELLGDEDQ
jgi:hypothetical protein